MGLGLELAQTRGFTQLSQEIREVLGSPKDREMQRETSASAHGSQPPEELLNSTCQFFCSTSQNRPRENAKSLLKAELSFPRRHLSVTGWCYSTSRQKLP